MHTEVDLINTHHLLWKVYYYVSDQHSLYNSTVADCTVKQNVYIEYTVTVYFSLYGNVHTHTHTHTHLSA